MSNTYYLFLDESLPDGDLNNFCFGGCIIEDGIYKKEVINKVYTLKTEVFDDRNVILHETDIRSAKTGVYKKCRIKEKREKFWDGLREIYNNTNITTIASVVNDKEYSKYYNSSYSNNCFYISLQTILENFVHFLILNNGIGHIYIEERNAKESLELRNLYYSITANGTLYFDKNVFQERLVGISFQIKEDNNIGLQLADFIPNSLNRYYSGKAQKEPNILNEILNKQYDGGIGLKDKFGFKKLF